MAAPQLQRSHSINAQLSTGPTSPEGKAISSLNAVKTGLTGRTVLLPNDDAVEYEHFLHDLEDEFEPVGQRERDLVQSIIDTMWRLRRIPALEMGIFARGHVEFAGTCDDSMIEIQTLLVYERQIRNLHLQEARLVRRRERELSELMKLQQERKAKEAEEAAKAAEAAGTAAPSKNGFEFSEAELEHYLTNVYATLPAIARSAAMSAAPETEPRA